MDRIAAMNALIRVAEAGTFTKAADTLDLPNATLTRLVQALERDPNVRLLHRTPRTVTVTPEGAAYYERVVRFLADLAEIEAIASGSAARPHGKVRVESTTAIGTMVILPALADFYNHFPDVEIELGLSNKRVDMVAEGVDCVIRAGDVHEQSMVARRVGEFHLMTCASPELLETYGTPTTPEEVKARPTVGMIRSRSSRAEPFRFIDSASEIVLELDPQLTVNNTHSYLAAAVAGLGIIQAPSYAVLEAVKAGKLVPLLQDWKAPGSTIHVIYPPNRYLSAKVRVFIDWTIALLQRHEYLQNV